MKSALSSLLVFTLFLGVAGCGDGEISVTEKTGKRSSDAFSATSVVDRQELEKKMSDLGLELYRGAEFSEIKKGRGDNYMLVYTVPDTSPESVKKVRTFYAREMNEIALKKGLKKISSNPLIYMDSQNEVVVTISNYLPLGKDEHVLTFIFPVKE
ncbi:MAG: hypothetical protein GF409_00010 [Candidatus Omnitrophica bacterium]|nr:hypothetical protein [Candidatus Omnitrophota bacterium]